MFDVGSVIAKVRADVSDFKQGMKTANDNISDLKKGMDGLSGAIKIAVGALAGLAIGAAFKDVVSAASDAQKEMVKTNALLEQAAKVMPKSSFLELSDAVKETSKSFIKLGFDDEETAKAMAKSLLVTKDLTESKKELALAADFARLQDIGISDAQRVLQMAYMGNARVLKQYGIELSDNATKQEIFNKIQAVAGGQAEAFANSFAGSTAQFDVQVSNLKEAIGENFLPVLVQLFTVLNDIVGKMSEMDFSFIKNAVDALIPVFYNLIFAIQDFVTKFKEFFNANLMPFIVQIVEFFRMHWDEIKLIIEAAWGIIRGIIEIAIYLIGGSIITFLQFISEAWKNYGDEIILIVTGAFNIIKGIIEVAMGIIYAIVGFVSNAIKGDWNAAWLAIVNGTQLAINGLKSILTGLVDFIKGWGGWIVDSLTKPFRDAWNTIQDLMKKIKDGIDFTKRHSPSVIDIIEHGVDMANKALSGLDYGINMSPHATLAAPVPGSAGNITTVSVHLDGAMIADENSATRMGELVGDSIMRKLKTNIRV